MSLSNSTLSAIQQAGAAVYAADTELKNAVRDYARRVNAAMAGNPYGLGNDALFENWKVVARLSQTMGGIEDELRKVYRVASELITDDQPGVPAMPALAAPRHPVGPVLRPPLDLTTIDVVAKRKKKAGPADLAGAARGLVAPSGNAAKLLQYLNTALAPGKFTVISQTAAGRATGIPLGSMTAAIKKLAGSGQIIAGPSGGFQLANSQR